jgi:hypothetical protein
MPKKPEKKVTKHIAFVVGFDWVGMYVDGELVCEGHSLQPGEIVAALGMGADYIEPNQEWLYEFGSFPKKLTDVVTGG